MSYSRICSMRSIQKTTFCGFIALLNKVLDFGGQLADKLSFILGTYTHLQTTRCSDTNNRSNTWNRTNLSSTISILYDNFGNSHDLQNFSTFQYAEFNIC